MIFEKWFTDIKMPQVEHTQVYFHVVLAILMRNN